MESVPRTPTVEPLNRLGALSKLPVFFNLAGQRVVVAGGSHAAAWKAEMLAAAGANVEIWAREISEEMQALMQRGAAAGTLELQPCDWTPELLHGAALAVGDIECELEARAFHDAAIAAGAKVNVIDKPAYCQFQFGSIVNRSPVVVAISTDGAAPIFAQAIRRRIETLLPPSLAAWGKLAMNIRGVVMDTLKPGAQRRAFWEQLAERVFGPPPTNKDETDLIKSIRQASKSTPASGGHVTLVGAGPGNPELLTLKAVRTLQSADVVLFDDLVSQEVLELSRREAKRMLVGKRGGRKSCAQGDINALMVKLAKQGKHVVRLKSGDPTIFGRAGEEIGELRAHGIPVAIVPGITTASAMASRLTVSLTHRDHAHSVRFVTGHSRNGVLPEALDWDGIADPETTVIFYMGARTAPLIADRLMSRGLPAKTPVAIMAAVTRPDEQVWLGSLGTLSSGIKEFDISLPIIVGIGEALSNASIADRLFPSVAQQRDGALLAAS